MDVLSNKVVAITGAGRGIGLATAQLLASRGAKVAIGDIDPEAVAEAISRLGERARGFVLDVTDRASFTDFLDSAERELGPLTTVINNAGIMHLGRAIEEDDEVTARQIGVNLSGVILGSKLGVARLLANGGGHLINVGSGTSKAALAGGATYGATKHAVYGYSEALAAEHRSDPLAFTVIMPTPVKTRLTAGLKSRPFARPVDPQDVATAIVSALMRPRFDVYVPRSLGITLWLGSVLPYPLRSRFGRLLRADKVLGEFDAVERAGYEQRVFD